MIYDQRFAEEIVLTIACHFDHAPASNRPAVVAASAESRVAAETPCFLRHSAILSSSALRSEVFRGAFRLLEVCVSAHKTRRRRRRRKVR